MPAATVKELEYFKKCKANDCAKCKYVVRHGLRTEKCLIALKIKEHKQ